MDSNRKWRALIRVNRVGDTYAYVHPYGFGGEDEARLLLSELPQQIATRMREGQERFHAWCNIGADNIEDVVFERWEVS